MIATAEVVDRILIEMDQMNTPITVFLDLSKDFDTLDHDILQEKLQYESGKNISCGQAHRGWRSRPSRPGSPTPLSEYAVCLAVFTLSSVLGVSFPASQMSPRC